MSLPRYERYTSFGPGWLSALPEHWKVVPNRAVLRDRIVAAGDKANEHTLLSLTLKGVIARDLESAKGKFPAEFDTYKLVAAKDLILCLFDMDETPRTVGLANAPGIITGAYEVFSVLPTAIPEFLYYFYLHVDSFKGLKPWYTGLRKVVRPDTFRSIKIPLPPQAEQRVIAAFLDHETAKIDALIQEQQRLIELLKEKRQAVISHAVTKGLDPTARMKDSSADWMGEIPAHWTVTTLGRISTNSCDGPFGSGLKSEHYSDSGVRVIRLQNIKQSYFDATDAAFINEEYYAALGDHSVNSGDVLIAGLGDDNNPVGRACVAPAEIEPAMVKADCFRFRLLPSVCPEFASAQLSAGAVADGRLATGSTRSRISLSKMASRTVALPPWAEQRAIATAIGDVTEKLSAVLLTANTSITLLQERRAALISAAVTGKIDVRNYTPRESTPASHELHVTA